MLDERHAQTRSSANRVVEQSWPDRDGTSLLNSELTPPYRLFLDPHTGEQASAPRAPRAPAASCQRLAMLELLTPCTETTPPVIETWPRLPALVTHHTQHAPHHAGVAGEVDDSAHVKMVAELSASIAHEICQPLLGIAANAAASLRWLQRDTPNVDEAIAGLKDIRAGCERAASIVKALGALARQSPLQPHPIRIDDVIAEAIALAAPALATHRVRLEKALSADSVILADPVQLQQLVLNLITNALEAMAGCRVGDGVLRISSKALSGGIEVCVDDNGPGVAPEQRQQIFGAFYTTKSSGLGVGLAICRSVIDAHQGSICAETSNSGGARIRFSLPARCDTP